MRQQMSINDLRAFKQFIESDESGIAGLVNDIKYGYNTPMNVYRADVSDGVFRCV